MANTKSIVLAGEGREVPLLPIRLNKTAYPICRKLHNEGLLTRIIENKGQVDCSAEEIDDLIELAFIAAVAADPTLTREAFDDLPITPPELVDCYFTIRYQTGAWIAPEGAQDQTDQTEEKEPGEARGAETLPT